MSCVSVIALEHVAGALQRLAFLVRRERELFALLAVERAAGARLDALAFHRRIEPFGVEAQALVAGEILDEVTRQPVAVIELERLLAGHHLVGLGGALEHFFEPRQVRWSAPRRTVPLRS